MEFEGRQRHTISEIASWLACAALLFVLAKNFSEVRRLVAETIVGHQLVTTNTASAAAALRDETSGSRDGVELVADRTGHFAAKLDVNGRDIEALVDTGASIVMLTYDDAQRAGIYLRDSDFTMQMQTANGLSRAAPVMLERVAIGPILVRNVQAGVAERGVLRTNLLGMSFLKRLQSFEIRSGRLVLKD
jgi:aspartyl protease family protein